ncbi:site-specific integrase [Phycicoccus duodecadis]|uniref:Site-specific recombinase XerC n=1 Tax=Phycicoccus duodecadis TaxID=173053 RepID=A0A2N3YIK1_9MICO|nr:site-specific integrase [Phycicoccus duodecadis]PKW26675.1 site-specific recombinase XerC [Phycicoccus duodecadis]
MRRLGLGEYGDVTYSKEGRSVVAMLYYRDYSGRRRRIRRNAPTRATARREVMTALQLALTVGDEPGFTASSSLAKAADAWLEVLEERVERGTRSATTLDLYRHAVQKHIRPGIGELRLGELTVPRVDRFLQRVLRTKGYSTAKLCRTVLSGISRWLVRQGGLPFNPVRDTAPLELDRDRTARAMTPAQIREWLDILDADEFARRHDLPELARFILATGLRLGEALGVRWSDIDPDRGSLRVQRTIVRVKGKGLVASRPKTRSSQRVLVLPGWCLTMLQARRARLGVVGGPVFADSLGGYRDRNNVGAAFRRVRTGTGFEWVTPHTFRKTVATLLDSKGASARMIADQLGHSRVSMTQDVYMGRRAVSAELAEALESLDDHQRPQPRRRDGQ